MNIEKILLKELNKAFKNKEVPVGCVIVRDGKVIAKAHNTKQKTHKVINHAEIIAITKAAKKIKDWRLDDCEMYVTLEPCKMCKEVIRQSRIKKVFYFLSSNFTNEDSKMIDYIKLNSSKETIDEIKRKISLFFDSKR